VAKANLNCPACGAGLRVAAFECPDCGIEVKGKFDFVHTPFDALSEKQVDFLMAFLKCQGNMSRVQNELQLSYPTAKKKLNEVLITLGLLANTTEKKEEIKVMDVNCWNVAENSQRASDVVKRKLKSCGGRAIVTSYSGKEYEVWAEADGKKFGSDALHGITHEYEIFDVVVDYLNTHKGWDVQDIDLGNKGSQITVSINVSIDGTMKPYTLRITRAADVPLLTKLNVGGYPIYSDENRTQKLDGNNLDPSVRDFYVEIGHSDYSLFILAEFDDSTA